MTTRPLPESERVTPPPITHTQVHSVSIVQTEGDDYRVEILESMGSLAAGKFEDRGPAYRRSFSARMTAQELPFLDELLNAVQAKVKAGEGGRDRDPQPQTERTRQ